jgi:Fe-Mn family superoxide dismutase
LPIALTFFRDPFNRPTPASLFTPRSTAAVQGSGWGWLGLDADTGRLQITTCANQDTVAERGLVPLLGVDVWEHAVWLDYKSDRATYIKNLWTITNWAEVSRRFDAALKK